jgi:hypothetical protein
MNELKTYLKPLINNIAQLVTRYIKNWADTTEIKGCGSLQTLCRLDSNLLRMAELFIYRNSCAQSKMTLMLMKIKI